jgi:hypothetical protein
VDSFAIFHGGFGSHTSWEKYTDCYEHKTDTSRPERGGLRGDGDIVGIGLSHFVHAVRRNTDILVIMGNNMVYGMTGGQVAPTTPFKSKTATTPYGSFEHPLDATRLAVAAGAAYLHVGQRHI